MPSRLGNLAALVILVLGAGFSGAYLATHGPWAGRVNAPPAAVIPPARGPESFAPVFERVSPAVVSVYAASAPTPPMIVIPPDPFGAPRLVPPMQSMSSGSGFFVSADGYILTNNHVVEDARDIEIVTHDERRLRARLVGRDARTDLAVLKVDGRRFDFVDLKLGVKPRVGDWVIAIGNPYGLGVTATVGVVSAYGRDIGGPFVDYVQLDAPINQGNSGGPSFDAQGRLVGVNTAILSPSGGNVGIGFAIPADVARDVAERLIARASIP